MTFVTKVSIYKLTLVSTLFSAQLSIQCQSAVLVAVDSSVALLKIHKPRVRNTVKSRWLWGLRSTSFAQKIVVVDGLHRNI